MISRGLSIFISLCFATGLTPAAEVEPCFQIDVMAAISKAGCNLGTCHGNATGKGGFKLSLRGQDPDFDFVALTREAAGRRVSFFAPEESLLLQKGANQLAHEGGRRLDPKGWEYGVLREWIANGAPRGDSKRANLTKMEVSPREVVLDGGQHEQQIKVTAHFADGTRRDITEQAVYEPLQIGLVDVSKQGLVKRLKAGEPTVLVRYLGLSQPVRLIFVDDRHGFVWRRPLQVNFVDRHVFSKLKTLRMNPSPMASDAVFVRRAYLDLVGMIPTAEEARSFVEDRARDKRLRLVDRLMSRPEFADFWALKWADVLKVESRTLDEKGMKAFHGWIRESIATNRPMDAFVRDLISARGSTYHEPQSNFYRANRTPTVRAETAAQVFLGTRLQCAQCHNHPFDRWTQDDYYNWAAVFAQVDYKIIENKRGDKNDTHEFKGEQVVFLNPKLTIDNPRIGDPAKPRLLGADMPSLKANQDSLQAAAAWLTEKGNPMFARSQANRIWYHLMGRGLVDPVDDLRVTNPPSHPELLDQLAQELIRSGYDLRHLIRIIMLSSTYQLDSTPTPENAADISNYAYSLPRRLSAEQMLDSLHGALGVSAEFTKQPAGTRASQLPGPRAGRGSGASDLKDDSPETFLAQFGRPRRELACECERASDTSMSQAFQLISGPLVQKILTRKDNRLGQMLRKNLNPPQSIQELYWAVLSRAPAPEEESRMTSYLSQAKDRRAALEDLTWSLINAKEFVLRR